MSHTDQKKQAPTQGPAAPAAQTTTEKTEAVPAEKKAPATEPAGKQVASAGAGGEGEPEGVEWTSQLGQDKWVARHFQHKRGGFFVDIGAHDGKSLSNTWPLEKHLGWRGICAEPLETKFAKLVAARPASTCVRACLYDKDGETVDFQVDEHSREDGMFSGVKQDLTHRGIAGSVVKLQTTSLQTLLDEHRAPAQIDFLSLDTEGSELKILRGLDWTVYSFGVISVEHNYHQPARSQIGAFLSARGYRLAQDLAWDDLYVRAV
jgi:FkbM family methyltransferase